MATTSPAVLSDRDLLDAVALAVARERHATAELLALLAELDSRRLYLGEGYSSLFVYCTRALRLCEPAAYRRITAARLARRFPVILGMLTDGSLTLTTVTLLAPHMTEDNCDALIDAARGKTKREVEHLIACLFLQPDVPTSMRKLPRPKSSEDDPPATGLVLTVPWTDVAECSAPRVDWRELQTAVLPRAAAAALQARPVVAPSAPERYMLKVTISAESRAKLDRARDLLRHAIPTGDPAAIIERALTALLEQLERRKLGAARRPRSEAARTSQSRHVPAAVKRVVWARDRGQCAFIGAQGRCVETGFLEFHHVVPYAAGGATDGANLELRCRAHNAYEAKTGVSPDRRDTFRNGQCGSATAAD